MNANLARKIIEKRIEDVEGDAFKAFLGVPIGKHSTLERVLDLMVNSGNAVDATIGKLARLGDALCAKKAIDELEGLRTPEPDKEPNEEKAEDKQPHPDFIVKSFSSEEEMNDFIKNQMKDFLKDTFGILF